MKEFNLDVLDSAAIVGNGGHESGGFKSLQEIKPVVPGSRGGYGIMQWTGPRRRAYEAFCKKLNIDPSSMEANWEFLKYELSETPEKRALVEIRKHKTLDTKTESFMKMFLRPGVPHLQARKDWALRALHAYEKRTPAVVLPEKPVEKKNLIDILIDIFLKILGR
jgi:hypothetical protein